MTSALPGRFARFEGLAAPAAAVVAHGLRMLSSLVIIKFIAVVVGPVGLGFLGNLMSVATIVAVFAGGGIVNGITKYVAEYNTSPARLERFLASASAYGMAVCGVCLLITIVAARPLATILFGTAEWAWLLPLLGLAHCLSFVGGGIVAIVNGQRRPVGFAAITVVAYLFVIPLAFVLINRGGLEGAAIALLAVTGATAPPAIIYAWRAGILGRLVPRLDGKDTRNLFRFTCIAAVSAIAFPVTEIAIRSQITTNLGLDQTGIWQGLARLSGAILGFYTLYLATSHMPRLSAIEDRGQATRAVLRTLTIIAPTFAACAVVIYLARAMIVPLLFADSFKAMETVIGWQLIGDLFRVCSYVVAFLGIAKAALKIHIVAELTQCLLYLALTTLALRSGADLTAVAQAYAATYAIYLLLTLVALREYARR